MSTTQDESTEALRAAIAALTKTNGATVRSLTDIMVAVGDVRYLHEGEHECPGERDEDGRCRTQQLLSPAGAHWVFTEDELAALPVFSIVLDSAALEVFQKVEDSSWSSPGYYETTAGAVLAERTTLQLIWRP